MIGSPPPPLPGAKIASHSACGFGGRRLGLPVVRESSPTIAPTVPSGVGTDLGSAPVVWREVHYRDFERVGVKRVRQPRTAITWP